MPDSSSPAEETLERILALTPEVPSIQDAAAIVQLGSMMLEERETEFAILRVQVAQDPDAVKHSTRARALCKAIALRDRQWTDCLEWARGELSQQRLATQRAAQFRRLVRQNHS